MAIAGPDGTGLGDICLRDIDDFVLLNMVDLDVLFKIFTCSIDYIFVIWRKSRIAVLKSPDLIFDNHLTVHA